MHVHRYIYSHPEASINNCEIRHHNIVMFLLSNVVVIVVYQNID